MSKETAFLAVYRPLRQVLHDAAALLEQVSEVVLARQGGNIFARPKRPSFPLALSWLRESLRDPCIRQLEEHYFVPLEQGLKLCQGAWETIEAGALGEGQDRLQEAQEQLDFGYDLVDVYIETLQIHVFGQFGAILFEMSVDRLPDEFFKAGECDYSILRLGSLQSDISTLPPADAKPVWIRDIGNLYLGTAGPVIKRISRIGVAKNVVLVLDAFQEEGWPEHVDDPLPKGRNPERLRETVKRLNDNLTLIRFRSDGKGEGVVWERI